jgi:cobyrinic acid a,c-diamide synthase
MLDAPVILAIAPKKVTRTVAAWVAGCKTLDNEVNIAGVILTGVAGKRHSRVITEAVERYADTPVLGVIPRISGSDLLPSRHLGLITPAEFESSEDSLIDLRKVFEENVDVGRIIEIADQTPDLKHDFAKIKAPRQKKFTVGYFKDKSFSFYYPENLEALADEGAEMRPVSSIDDPHLPADIDALYIGGGFPETNLPALVANRSMMRSVRQAAENGLPIYAECGGLIYLSKFLFYKGHRYEMAGVFPAEITMCRKPQGHGYSIMEVDSDNPYFERGRRIKGHEFHYTTVENPNAAQTCLRVERGSGAYDKRDGFTAGNTFATYLHLHALSETGWAKAIANKAVEYRKKSN